MLCCTSTGAQVTRSLGVVRGAIPVLDTKARQITPGSIFKCVDKTVVRSLIISLLEPHYAYTTAVITQGISRHLDPIL